MSNVKKKCDLCKKEFSQIIRFKSDYYCKRCFIKQSKKIPKDDTIFTTQEKIRTVRSSGPSGIINVPKQFIGYKVKIKFVDIEDS